MHIVWYLYLVEIEQFNINIQNWLEFATIELVDQVD